MKSLILSTISFFAIAIPVIAVPDGLVRLYEEEILAHDLYVALGQKFPEVMPLKNIPQSELRHRAALAAVLKAEGIDLPKPAAGQRFVSAGLDATYAKWLAEGQESAAAACRAGVRLEDHDIADLRKAQREFPKHQAVLAQLEAASNNHLRAFHRNLTARGGEYTAEAIPADDFKAILAGTNTAAGGCAAGCGPNGCGQGKPAGKGSANATGCGLRPKVPAEGKPKAAAPKGRGKVPVR
jgi:hypothetical protein